MKINPDLTYTIFMWLPQTKFFVRHYGNHDNLHHDLEPNENAGDCFLVRSAWERPMVVGSWYCAGPGPEIRTSGLERRLHV